MTRVYTGRLLRVDLDRRAWGEETIVQEDIEKYLLGSGLAARLLYGEMDPGLEPLDSRCPIFFMTGLLTGTLVPASCRISVCGRSPLTGIWNESTAGGYFGAELRSAGWDGMVITGRGELPAYLWLSDDGVEIRDASHHWGYDSYQTAQRIRGETDPAAQVASIGPAGEKLVHIAGIVFGGTEARLAGRGGMGALMGSKNLKAVAVMGSRRPSYHDPVGLRKAVREANSWIRDNGISLAKFGTAGGLVRSEESGDLPIKNWLEGSWNQGVQRISGQRIMEAMFVRHYRCFACPIGCGKDIQLKEGNYAGLEGHGPEYETLGSFGSLLLNDNLESIVRVNDLCNRYGLDTISAGAVVALAVEAYERGLLTQKDTGGLKLAWGSSEFVVPLVEMIAQREGLGDLLAGGVREAALRLGPEAQDLAIHTKGLEIPMHDPRAFLSIAVNYATANRGGCHLEAPTYWYDYGMRWEDWGSDWEPNCHVERDKAREARDFQDYIGLYNPLGLCKFMARSGVGPDHLSQWIRLALGWDTTKEELLLTGERLFNLKRLLNLRLGVSAKDDSLPQRLLAVARPSGKAAGVLPNLGVMLKDYYALRGWTPEGIPGEAKLAALGLSDLE